MTNGAWRTRGDAWAWAILSLFGSSSADASDDGTNGEATDDTR